MIPCPPSRQRRTIRAFAVRAGLSTALQPGLALEDHFYPLGIRPYLASLPLAEQVQKMEALSAVYGGIFRGDLAMLRARLKVQQKGNL